MDSGSSTFIPSEITTAITAAIENAKDSIIGVVNDNFDTLMLIVGCSVGISLALWGIGLVSRFMRRR